MRICLTMRYFNVNDENLRKQMDKNARKSAERYSWNMTAERTLEVYEKVLKR